VPTKRRALSELHSVTTQKVCFTTKIYITNVEVLTSVIAQIVVVWVMTPHNLVGGRLIICGNKS
jgi:hypothetical protein